MKLRTALAAALLAATISVPTAAIAGTSSSRANETTVSPAAFKTISTLQRQLSATKKLLAKERARTQNLRARIRLSDPTTLADAIAELGPEEAFQLLPTMLTLFPDDLTWGASFHSSGSYQNYSFSFYGW